MKEELHREPLKGFSSSSLSPAMIIPDKLQSTESRILEATVKYSCNFSFFGLN